ncbi:MAG: PAS-domain containing protein [Azospirillaceae bacterium]
MDGTVGFATPQGDLEGALMAAMPHGVAAFDADQRLRRYNARLAEMLGEARRHLCVGLSRDDFLDLLPAGPDGDRAQSRRREELRSGLGLLPVMQWTVADGRAMELRTARGADGGHLVLLTDITAFTRRTAAEGRLMEALRIAPAPILVLDPDDRVFMWNEALVRLNAEAMLEVGLPFDALLRRFAGADQQWSDGHPVTGDDVETWIRRRLEQHRTYRGPFEERMSDDRWYLTTEQRTADGSTVIMHVEISDLRRAEAEARAAKEAADKANRAKSDFLANMSHELRTPLNAVMGFSEIIRDQTLGPVGVRQYAEYAADIHDSGSHLLELVNTILDLSKIEAGRFELLEQTVDVTAEIATALRLMELRAAKAELRLVDRTPAGLPGLTADRRAVRQMLLNLLSNAVRFTPAGGTVTLAAEAGPDGLAIRVADTGIGIAPHDLAQVMLPFGQVVEAQRGERTGTGLGLPLVKALIERHGGIFAIDTAPNEGTTVSLTFPPERITLG